MKRWIGFLLCLVLAFALAACGSGKTFGKAGNQPAGVKDVLEQGMAEADGKNNRDGIEPAEVGAPDNRQNTADEETIKAEPSTAPDAAAIPEEPSEGIDVDLTALSATMVYSEVYSMMSSPEDYIGKTVKMGGLFAYYHDEATDNYYFACIIQDAAACCAQGIEFVLTEDYAYPDDYPEVNEEICVVGVLDTYREGSYTYLTLRNARLIQQ